MAKKAESKNLIWQGRLHVGDEPGAYGDSTYVGLNVELPVELIPHSEEYASRGEITLVLNAEGIEPARGYPGHQVTVVAYGEKNGAGRQPSSAKKLAEGRLDIKGQGELRLTVKGDVPRYVAVRIAVDQEVDPGLYLETVISRLSLISSSHYAYLGYRYRGQQAAS